MTPNIELAKPRDFGEIINDTFAFVRQNLKPLLKYFFIFCGFFILASAATSILIQGKALCLFNNVSTSNVDEAVGTNVFANASYIIINALFAMVFILLEYMAITVMVLCYMT